jgi:hypothetical protein
MHSWELSVTKRRLLKSAGTGISYQYRYAVSVLTSVVDPNPK